jgi:hypothetical protein
MSDSRAARFGSPISVELDAIDPRRLRQLAEGVPPGYVGYQRTNRTCAGRGRNRRC